MPILLSLRGGLKARRGNLMKVIEMSNILTNFFPQLQKKPDSLLKPVESELSALEKDLKESLFCGNIMLDGIISYFFQSGGKRLRPAMVLLIGKAIGGEKAIPSVYKLALAIEMIHTASLIHDDVIDDAETRRGMLTINKKWDAKTAVIAGDYILAGALKTLTTIGTPAVEIFANTLNELCVGEISQKTQSYSVISIDEYLKKSERKTAKLFAAGAECAATLTAGENNGMIAAARDYALNFGIAFQIIDDILNFTEKDNKTGKPAGNDLKNGIITAPVIFAIEDETINGKSELKTLLNTKFKNESEFDKALKLVTSSKGIEKSFQLAENYTQKAIDCLSGFNDSKYKQALIELVMYSMERKS